MRHNFYLQKPKLDRLIDWLIIIIIIIIIINWLLYWLVNRPIYWLIDWSDCSERLYMEMADAMYFGGYSNVGYKYICIDVSNPPAN